MKTSQLLRIATWAAVLAAAGCGEEASRPATSGSADTAARPSIAKAVDSAAVMVDQATKNAGAEAAKAVDATNEKLQEASKAVQGAAAEASAALAKKFEEWVPEARKLIAEGKGAEAIQRLQASLANFKLSPEQQRLIDDLKAQAQEAFSRKGFDAVAKSANDLLRRKTNN